jgi:AraC-like DNA-binding protein
VPTHQLAMRWHEKFQLAARGPTHPTEAVASMRRNDPTVPQRLLIDKAQQQLYESPVSAAEHADEALALALRRGDQAMTGDAALLAAQAHWQCGQYKKAETCLAQSISAFEASGLRKRIGAAYVLQSKVFFSQDRIGDAQAAAMTALGYPGMPAKERARLYATVATCFADRADLASGRRVMLEHALPEAERSGDPSTFVILHTQGVGLMHVYALWALGIPHANTVGIERPSLERPQVYIDTAMRYASACEPYLSCCSPAERAFAASHRALIVSLVDGWQVARPMFDETLLRAADLPKASLGALGVSGLAARVAGEFDEARKRLEEARAHPAAQTAYYQRAIAFDLAQVYAALNQPVLALEAMNRFAHLQTSKGKLATGWHANPGATHAIRGPVDTSAHIVAAAKTVSPAVLKRAIEFIEQNLTRRLVLDEVARHVGISKRTLQSLHKEHYGMSTSEFIRERRMQRAKEILARGQTSISEVADLIGYSSPANFSRDFRKRFGRVASTARHEGD